MECFRRLAQRIRGDARRGTAAAAIVLAASALAVGCGSSSRTERVEKGIESSLSTSSVKVTEAS